MRQRVMNAPPRRRPRFLWQGLLIVLPAILLAAFGLFSLRQDRLLAQHEAVEQAKAIATALAHVQLPQAFQAESLALDAVTNPQTYRKRPEEDPILSLARNRVPGSPVRSTKRAA